MKILVAIKQVPEVAEAEVAIAGDGRSIETEDLSFDLGEWEACAVETAIRRKEADGSSVTLVTVGPEDSETALRKGLAMGADAAVRIAVEDGIHDPLVVARLIAAWAAERGFDLVLTGVMAADDGHGAVGPALAHQLSFPHATMVVGLEFEQERAVVTRELEDGLLERIAVPLPAVLGVQTGLAEPRYVSIMGIRRVRKIPIEVWDAGDVGIDTRGRVELLGLAPPPAEREVKMIEGSAPELAERMAELVREVTG